MASKTPISTYLSGHLLMAMPQMDDPRFRRSVIYICAHSADGAMGLIVNRRFDAISFPDLLEQLNIEVGPRTQQIRVHCGGPVETGRGFVLHSDDYVRDGTMVVKGGFALTATIDILKAIATGEGPRQSLLALGYAGWAPGQLESEITANGWLAVPADVTLVFDPDLEAKWSMALAKLGVNLTSLAGEAGHA